MNFNNQYVLHGPRLRGPEFFKFVDHIYEGNLRRLNSGQDSVPCCIWGKHGIGKTQSMRDYARRRRVGFRQINPAQFEEMGDITGMPRIHDQNTPGDHTDDVTYYAKPDWAQDMHSQGPEGILLLDDFNRAGDRIIRGLMQLLQDRRMVSWALPPRWQIFLSANPDGGDYGVTPIDSAVLTRMSHVTMEFDYRAWADWARANGIDQRGIDFVVGYPELIGDGKTTARSLVNLFRHIQSIPDLGAQLDLVDALARSCIDDTPAATFVSFVRNYLREIPDADEILEAQDIADVMSRLRGVTDAGGRSGTDDPSKKGPDVRGIMVERMVGRIRASRGQLSDRAKSNAAAFLLDDWLLKDLRFAALTQLREEKWLVEDRRVKAKLREFADPQEQRRV